MALPLVSVSSSIGWKPFNLWLEAVHQHKRSSCICPVNFEGYFRCNVFIKTCCIMFWLYCLCIVWLVQPLWWHFACLQMSTLCLSASLLEHFQCFPREDVFLISALGSVRGNTVPRGSIEPYTPGSRECIGYYDLCRSCHSISSLLPVDTKKYIPTVRWILTVLKSILPW